MSCDSNFDWQLKIVAASNASVYTEACLLVADRPQAPVTPGAGAPGVF